MKQAIWDQARICGVSILLGLLCGAPTAAQSNNFAPPEFVIDWERKVDAHAGLTALDTGLLGDSIDPHTGSISLQNTDISLAGNSNLEVAVSRRLTSGRLYHLSVHAEFGDWELAVPRISAITHRDSNWRTSTGNRCSDPESALQTVQTPVMMKRPEHYSGGYVTMLTYTQDGNYSDGYKIDLPGHGKQALLENRGQVQLQEDKGSQFVTTSGVSVTCLPSAVGGGEGFEATTPDGTVYTFNRFIEHRYTDMEYTGYTLPDDRFKRFVSMVVATQATDVHGNTVDYNYDVSGRLTSIHANDGRHIDLVYNGSEHRIAHVDVNGRRWSYTYEHDLAELDYWEGHNVSVPVSTLRTVKQPDQREWAYDLVQMNAPAPAADSCHSSGAPMMSVTHPYGVTGSFYMRARLHRVSFDKISYRERNTPSAYCPYFGSDGGGDFNNFGDPVPNVVPNPIPPISYLAPIFVMSIDSKTLSGPGLPSMTWEYTYEWDLGGLGSSANDRTNWTEIEQPDDTVHTYYHVWGTEYVDGGKLVRKKISDANGTVLREEEYEYNVMVVRRKSPANLPTVRRVSLTMNSNIKPDLGF